ncbi:unnamed protein product [Calicophoron daubneyi]|uniref:Mannosyltransferase n=1 Tax=Calicophoron daubneyi TaxID=300641 RepID=A0AAV2THY8_CALDB
MKIEELLANERKLFVGLLVFRVLNAVFIQTAFVPDEYWQSMEVAHKWVFGYGSLTWEWRPEIALRSPVHPLLISIPYYLAYCLGLDSRRFIVLIPRLIHAVLAAIADLHLFRLASTLSGPVTAKWALFHQLSNWFTCFCATRPLSNCLEWCLTVVGLCNYPWHLACTLPTSPTGLAKYRTKRFIIIAISCVLIRPTAAVVWAPLCLLHLWQAGTKEWHRSQQKNDKKSRGFLHSNFWKLFKLYMLATSVLFCCSCAIDRFCFGRWTLNQWNFLQFNLLTTGSHFYGVYPWHWYLTAGLPAILTTQIPFLIIGVLLDWIPSGKAMPAKGPSGVCSPKFAVQGKPEGRLLSLIFFWTVVCYSFLGHKEFRFLFPLLPLATYFSGRATVFLMSSRTGLSSNTVKRAIMLFILLTHVPVTLYTSLLHQRGGLEAFSVLSQAIHYTRWAGPDAPLRTSDVRVLALMPCHSIPSLSYLHQNISFRQLTCDPDLSMWSNASQSEVDKADSFYSNPIRWMELNYNSRAKSPDRSSKPHYILFFSRLLKSFPTFKELLAQWDYRQCGHFFHAHFPTHSQHGKYVLAYCHSNVSL